MAPGQLEQLAGLAREHQTVGDILEPHHGAHMIQIGEDILLQKQGIAVGLAGGRGNELPQPERAHADIPGHHQAVVADFADFGGAIAHIDNQHALPAHLPVVFHPVVQGLKGGIVFLGVAEHLDLKPGGNPDLVHHPVAVGGLAQGAGGHHPAFVHLIFVQERPKAQQDFTGFPGGGALYAAGGKAVAAQGHALGKLVQHAQAVLVHFHDQQIQRAAAHVDTRQAPGRWLFHS